MAQKREGRKKPKELCFLQGLRAEQYRMHRKLFLTPIFYGFGEDNATAPSAWFISFRPLFWSLGGDAESCRSVKRNLTIKQDFLFHHKTVSWVQQHVKFILSIVCFILTGIIQPCYLRGCRCKSFGEQLKLRQFSGFSSQQIEKSVKKSGDNKAIFQIAEIQFEAT